MLKIEKFVKEQFGIELTKTQLEIIAMIAASPEENIIVRQTGRDIGKTTAVKAALAYLQDGLKASDTDKVDRFEVIDHRQCVFCRGRKTANYLQKDGSYKEQPCDKCDGSGISGGRVFTASSNAERSNIKVDLSYQDDGKTLKVFVDDLQPADEKSQDA